MRRLSCFTVLCTAAAATSLFPPDGAAAEAQAVLGAPRISFGSTGPLLTRNVAVGVDNGLVALELRSSRCIPIAVAASASSLDRIEPCADDPQRSRAWDGTHHATLTFKVPQWHAGAPSIDLSLRSWNVADNDLDRRGGSRGTAAELEITQTFGAYELVGGMSHPLATVNAGEWRSVWAGASVKLAPAARARFLIESSRELRSDVRDTRYTLQFARLLSGSTRVTAFLSHAPDDPDRPWRAGLGLELSF